jgi:amidase
MAVPTGLAMGWEGVMRHDANGARRSRAREEARAARADAPGPRRRSTASNGRLAGVLGLFADAVENPAVDGPDPAGRLHGVPIFLKDLGLGAQGADAGIRLADAQGRHGQGDRPTVANYLRAGLVPIGRSTTPEFGMTFDDTATDLSRADQGHPQSLERTAHARAARRAARRRWSRRCVTPYQHVVG